MVCPVVGVGECKEISKMAFDKVRAEIKENAAAAQESAGKTGKSVTRKELSAIAEKVWHLIF